MGSAKIVSLVAHPLQASHLCFEVDGVVEALAAKLGDVVTPTKQPPPGPPGSFAVFDFRGFCQLLESAPTGADASLLLYDAAHVEGEVGASALASLRAAPYRAVLDQAIARRQNAYHSKYGSSTFIINTLMGVYSPTSPVSKPNMLNILEQLANDQLVALSQAYATDDRTGVVKSTTSVLKGRTHSSEYSETEGTMNREDLADNIGSPAHLGALPQAGGSMEGRGFKGGKWLPIETISEGSSGETTGSTGSAYEQQTITNTDYAYRVPYVEAQAQGLRTQINLMDEKTTQYLANQSLPHLETIFANELRCIDLDVVRLQVALLNTMLTSPIPGRVTGVYKNPGDSVTAGEPVCRVEDDSTVLLAGQVVYRDRIAVGASVTLTNTALFGVAAPPTTIVGTVKAVNGLGDDDMWDVVIECPNLDPAGVPVLPLGYSFHHDDGTTCTVA